MLKNKSKYLQKFLPLLIIGVLILSGVIFARIQKKESGLIFNHKFHIIENEIECDQCHEINKKNNRFMNFPNHDICANCHDEEIDEKSKDKKCLMCHKQKDFKTSLRKNTTLMPLVNFDHKKHIDKKVNCEKCHLEAKENTQVEGNEILPQMNLCVKCHEQKKIRQKKGCSGCHPANYQGIRPSNHSPFWLRSHGKGGLSQEKIEGSCKICHNTKNNSDCMNCHRKEKPVNHTISWRIRTHANRALLDRQSCTTCHNQASCITCHSKTPPFSHTAMWGSPRNRHCYSCHLESGQGVGSNCRFCHGSGANIKHSSAPMQGHTDRTPNCLLCHTPGTGGSPPRIPHPLKDPAVCVICHRGA